MGQEIVYCFKCQKRILGTEVAKGLAYQVENQMCCSTCVVLVLDTLPPKAKEQLLAKMHQANELRQSASSAATKALPGSPSASSTGRIPTLAPRVLRSDPDGSSSTAIILGIGAALLAVLVAAIAFSGGTSTPPAPLPARTIKRSAPPPPPPPDPGLSPEEKRRADAASVAMKKARDFAAANSRDFEGQAKQWRAALSEAERSGYEAEARRELDKAEALGKEALGQEMAELDRQIRAPLARRDFRAAQELLDQARSRRSAADWGALIHRLQVEIQDAAARAFAELREKALAARDRGAKAELDAIKAAVATWGLPQYVTELETALNVAWRRLFDGKSPSSFMGADSVRSWTVVDGALMHAEGRSRSAGQSKDDLGDGEYRFRFSIQGSSQASLSVRQGRAGACRAVFRNRSMESLGSAEHELIFRCAALEVSATLDGKPMPLEILGTTQPTGRLQFGATDGILRITAVDFRPIH
jgi:hypothetical protein